MIDKRFVQIYTGNGRGKTVAALGLALRAAGADLKVLFITFMKSTHPYSELNSLSQLASHITLVRAGDDDFVLEKRPATDEECAAIEHGLDVAREAMQKGGYDMIVLDEIGVAVHFQAIAEEKVIDLIRERPSSVELILTGRYCPPSWLELADLVTDMQEIKHYYSQDITSRKGFDS